MGTPNPLDIPHPASSTQRIGDDILVARTARGMTQIDLAIHAGCGVSTIASIEKKKRQPSMAMLDKLCVALKTTPPQLFGLAARVERYLTEGH